MAKLLENITDDVKMSMFMDAVSGSIHDTEMLEELREWAMEVADDLPHESPHDKFCHQLIRELIEASLPDGDEHCYRYDYTLSSDTLTITDVGQSFEVHDMDQVSMTINKAGVTSFSMWSYSRYKSDYFLDEVAETLEIEDTAAKHLYDIACARYCNFAEGRSSIQTVLRRPPHF